MSHQERISVGAVDPSAYQAVLGLERYVRAGTLDESLLSLIKIRASRLNGCAYCLDMHAGEARAAGVEQRRLDILSAWREAPSCFSDRERAALALTEAVTLIGQAGVPDDVWTDVTASFDQGEIVQLLMAISVINVWNRIAVSTHQSLPENVDATASA
jgi:AhpD family alkylhydroperoxidase